MLSANQRQALELMARTIRRHVIEMTWRAQSGHPGGSLSIAEILSVLYFSEVRYDARQPSAVDRDRVILSKGHAAPALYAALVEAGFFPRSELKRLRSIQGLLEGHPCVSIPGVDVTSGSLGLGLSAGCGIALAARMTDHDQVRVYVILGDGELNEGPVWEAAMTAAHFHLDSLVAIVDRNRYQNDGATADIMGTEPLAQKWKSFGWNVVEIDGHDVEQVANAFDCARGMKGRPTVVIASTVKGSGVSYLLDRPDLHYKAPTTEQKDLSLRELGFEQGPDDE
ncbi:MAG TPA: transketolase [Methanomassiliicoccales archaeon]|nr:transketolase [Methanomassiliicoccales archaeon]